MPDTPYINKKTGEPNGQKCIQITVDEMLELELDDIIKLSYRDNTPIVNSRDSNLQAAKDFVYFVCDKLGITYTPTNSIDHLIDTINGRAAPVVDEAFNREFIHATRGNERAAKLDQLFEYIK